MQTLPELNSLHYGDCLEVMHPWPDASIDTCYLDPPFNSNAKYHQLYDTGDDNRRRRGTRDAQRNRIQVQAFNDAWRWNATAAERVAYLLDAPAHPAHPVIAAFATWPGEGGMLAYLSYMAERLVVLHRLLKPTGSVYLHCDATANYCLRMLMNCIFGPENFRREIVWQMKSRSGFKSQAANWIRDHDTILYYVKSEQATFNKQFEPYSEEYVARSFTQTDADGRRYRQRGNRRYYEDEGGIPYGDVWDDIHSFQTATRSREYLGYPTQKPLKLLERIILASTHEGDIVLDPFCGCGTTIAAADNLNRKWLGIDISPHALEVIKLNRFPGRSIPTSGIPADFAAAAQLAKANPRHFEVWALNRASQGLAPNDVQTGDGGIDGRGHTLTTPDEIDTKLVLAQVKGGRFQLGHLRDFLWTLERENAALGVFITLNPVTSRHAHAELLRPGNVTVGTETYPRVQTWSLKDYFEGKRLRLPDMRNPYTGKPLQPTLQLTL